MGTWTPATPSSSPQPASSPLLVDGPPVLSTQPAPLSRLRRQSPALMCCSPLPSYGCMGASASLAAFPLLQVQADTMQTPCADHRPLRHQPVLTCLNPGTLRPHQQVQRRIPKASMTRSR